VTGLAAPLLRWEQEADSKDDQLARMAAMRRQYGNDPALPKQPRDPEGFLAQARAHYEFIRGGAR
jgi:hypothetical protein